MVVAVTAPPLDPAFLPDRITAPTIGFPVALSVTMPVRVTVVATVAASVVAETVAEAVDEPTEFTATM